MKIEMHPQYSEKRSVRNHRPITNLKLSSWVLVIDRKPIARLATKADCVELCRVAKKPDLAVLDIEQLRAVLEAEASWIWDRRFKRQEERERRHYERLARQGAS